MQTRAVRDQTEADQAARAEAAASALEEARRARLERGVAAMRGSALAIRLEVQMLARISNALRPRAVAKAVERISDLLTPIVEASSAVKVNASQQDADLADELLQAVLELMEWFAAGPLAWRTEPEAANRIGNVAIDLERAMRAERGYLPLRVQ